MKVSSVCRFVASAGCVIDIDPPTVCDIGAVAGDPLLRRTVLRCLLQVDDPLEIEAATFRLFECAGLGHFFSVIVCCRACLVLASRVRRKDQVYLRLYLVGMELTNSSVRTSRRRRCCATLTVTRRSAANEKMARHTSGRQSAFLVPSRHIARRGLPLTFRNDPMFDSDIGTKSVDSQFK
jgi:hypothetical protein